MPRVIALFLVLLLVYCSRALESVRHDDRFALHPDNQPWVNITPSRSIRYHNCYQGLKCARLLLPLDWNNPLGQDEIAVAVVKRPAKVLVTDPRYGGLLIVNPGGPGASGVDHLLQHGERIQKMIDASDDDSVHPMHSNSKYFDVISFDVRGTHYTLPQVDCFPDRLSRFVWSISADTDGFIGSSSTAFDDKWTRYASRSATCMERVRLQGSDSIGYYMGTRSVADDIMAIVDRHGTWREAETRKLLSPYQTPMNAPEQEKLYFWGTSYGTILGSTLATLYPHRVHRMLLDSVVSPGYYWNMSLGHTLAHADTIFERFTQLCHKHGSQRCNCYRPSPEAIFEDITNAVSSLVTAPLAVPASYFRGPMSITYSDVKRLIAESLYNPHRSFPALASYLQGICEGNGTPVADYLDRRYSSQELFHHSKRCEKDGPYSVACTRPIASREETLLAISCGDRQIGNKLGKDDFKAYWHDAKNQSLWIGDMWTEWDLMCVGWDVETKWKYTGSVSGATAHPILIFGNQYDPVCPIENAYEIASAFPGAVVVQQNTIGHGLLTAHSKCAEKIVKAYFQDGRLPLEKVECDVDQEPFEQASRPHSPTALYI